MAALRFNTEFNSRGVWFNVIVFLLLLLLFSELKNLQVHGSNDGKVTATKKKIVPTLINAPVR